MSALFADLTLEEIFLLFIVNFKVNVNVFFEDSFIKKSNRRFSQMPGVETVEIAIIPVVTSLFLLKFSQLLSNVWLETRARSIRLRPKLQLPVQ